MAASALNSTIVRAFQVLEHVAPGAGARWGARLWFTPPPPIPLHRLAQPPPGEETGVELDGRTLRATAWGSGPLVLLVHGWGGRSEQLAALVGPLAAAGHRVVALDAPGHGRSGPGALGGRRSTVPEFAAALRAAATQEGGRVHAVVAHSLGATAAALAVREGLRPRRLVLLAPMGDPSRVFADFAARLGLGPRVRSRLERRVLRTVGLPWAAFDPAAAARAVAVLPVLVVHDRRDREVPFDEGRRVAGAWPDARLIATDGLGHRRLLRDPGVVDAVARFVAGSGAASPAGRWSA
jgi:pimeloyl-ACP methyl ester carboxylesterase